MKVNSLITNLNEEQRRAVEFTTGPLLILAGAGSGKTRVLVHRAAYLTHSLGITPEDILLVTFTNKAAETMQQRLLALTGLRLPFAGTFHSFCAKLLRRHGHHLGISSQFVIFDEQDQRTVIKKAAENLNLSRQFSPLSFLHTISAAKNELVGPSDYSQFAHGYFQEAVAKVYTEYQRLLKKSQALDFDDLLVEAVHLLDQIPSVKNKYQFLHVLVDEYQDTNKAQYRLTQLLSEKHQNLCVVGDFSQAIYGWRGADYRNLFTLQQDYPHLTTLNLTRNYRSTQRILDAANAVISHNATHPVLKLWTDNHTDLPIEIFTADTETDEAQTIIQKIEALVNQSIPLSQIAILYRTNAQSRLIEEILIKKSLPYTIVGGTEFYQRKEVKDVLAYLRLLVNPADAASLDRLFKVGKRRLDRFLSWSKTAQSNRPPLELLEKILEVTDYLGLFDPKVDEDLMRLENIQELKSVASEFADLPALLENVALVQNHTFPNGKSFAQKNDALNLMTLHASKGLEFDAVFIIGMEEGLFPHARSLLTNHELEEERRLCYVGLTRARKYLTLTHAKNRLYFGTHSRGLPSRFLSELSIATPHQQPSSNLKNSSQIDKFLNGEIDINTFLSEQN